MPEEIKGLESHLNEHLPFFFAQSSEGNTCDFNSRSVTEEQM